MQSIQNVLIRDSLPCAPLPCTQAQSDRVRTLSPLHVFSIQQVLGVYQALNKYTWGEWTMSGLGSEMQSLFCHILKSLG